MSGVVVRTLRIDVTAKQQHLQSHKLCTKSVLFKNTNLVSELLFLSVLYIRQNKKLNLADITVLLMTYA